MASLIEKETIEKRISNNEYRMSNVECRRKEFYRFLLIQKTERSDSILHDSAVRYSIFCGSLFSPAASCQSGQFNQKKNYIFVINDVSYEDLGHQLPDTRNLV